MSQAANATGAKRPPPRPTLTTGTDGPSRRRALARPQEWQFNERDYARFQGRFWRCPLRQVQDGSWVSVRTACAVGARIAAVGWSSEPRAQQEPMLTVAYLRKNPKQFHSFTGLHVSDSDTLLEAVRPVERPPDSPTRRRRRGRATCLFPRTNETCLGMEDPASIAEDDHLRSRHVEMLVRRGSAPPEGGLPMRIPRTLIQFWDDLGSIPADVRECMETWRALEDAGFARVSFDDVTAAAFIARALGGRYTAAFNRCRHPAMRCDYFRLCYIYRQGGFYVDADDAYEGGDWKYLYRDNRLKVQPLCYDVRTGSMVPQEAFLSAQKGSPAWIYYINNNPIVAPAGHPVLLYALQRATQLLLADTLARGGVQSTTGPGNFTASIVRHSLTLETQGKARDFELLRDWDAVAKSRWPLSYRDDQRNWRLWDPSSGAADP